MYLICHLYPEVPIPFSPQFFKAISKYQPHCFLSTQRHFVVLKVQVKGSRDEFQLIKGKYVLKYLTGHLRRVGYFLWQLKKKYFSLHNRWVSSCTPDRPKFLECEGEINGSQDVSSRLEFVVLKTREFKTQCNTMPSLHQ